MGPSSMEKTKQLIPPVHENHLTTGMQALKRAASSLSINKKCNDEEKERTFTTPKLLQAKFKMKEGTKFLLKLHVIKEKAENIFSLLQELKTLTKKSQDSIDRSDVQEQFVDKILEVQGEVNLAKKLTIFLCKHKALERHLSALKSIQDQMRPTLDISVQFFGVDWEHMFRISVHLIKLMDDLAEAFKNLSEESDEMDILVPNNILRNLAILEADICSHAEAVLKGRLSKKHQERITSEQKRFSIQDETNAALQLKRIESEVFEDSLKKRRKSLWGNIKREIQYGVFRKGKKESESVNNDLWKMWYSGVQSVRVPTMMPGQEEAGTPDAPPKQARRGSEIRRMSSFMLGERRLSLSPTRLQGLKFPTEARRRSKDDERCIKVEKNHRDLELVDLDLEKNNTS